jgi:hypothetical protein
MSKPECYNVRHKEFLDELRESGKTNMFGAGPYLLRAFPKLNPTQARDVLLYWMESFGTEGADGET